jgi:glycine/D-amino acid oxidase-like deaminating enzyme
MRRHVAVLGAGIQGSCVALALARRGCSVDLFDKEPEPITQASLWNEGKIHLGFIFANDPTGRTATTMMIGSMHFAAIFEQLTGAPLQADVVSESFTYVVHRDSMLAVETLRSHYAMVQDRYLDLRGTLGRRYFGDGSAIVFDELDKVTLSSRYDPEFCQAAFRTAEVSVDPRLIADRLRTALRQEPRICFHPSCLVDSIDADSNGRLRVHVATTGHANGLERLGPYDHAVNTLWEDRLRVDAMLGHRPTRPWLHRYKLALHARCVAGDPPPSTTIVLGPFGDVVNFGDGRFYFSWYPVCRLGASDALSPPRFEKAVTDGARQAVLHGTMAALARIVPSIAGIDLDKASVDISGGYVFAWGATDIDDRASLLHQRHDIGVMSSGNYHTIDTGKYCMAPYFAAVAAHRICN